jgi:hypothetical protein
VSEQPQQWRTDLHSIGAADANAGLQVLDELVEGGAAEKRV